MDYNCLTIILHIKIMTLQKNKIKIKIEKQPKSAIFLVNYIMCNSFLGDDSFLVVGGILRMVEMDQKITIYLKSHRSLKRPF
jgi:hypothetical protein